MTCRVFLRKVAEIEASWTFLDESCVCLESVGTFGVTQIAGYLFQIQKHSCGL